MITNNLKDRVFTSLALLFLLSLIIFFDFMMIYSLIVLGTLSLIEFLNLSKKIFKNSIILNICNLFFIIYISIFCLLSKKRYVGMLYEEDPEVCYQKSMGL